MSTFSVTSPVSDNVDAPDYPYEDDYDGPDTRAGSSRQSNGYEGDVPSGRASAFSSPAVRQPAGRPGYGRGRSASSFAMALSTRSANGRAAYQSSAGAAARGELSDLRLGGTFGSFTYDSDADAMSSSGAHVRGTAARNHHSASSSQLNSPNSLNPYDNGRSGTGWGAASANPQQRRGYYAPLGMQVTRAHDADSISGDSMRSAAQTEASQHHRVPQSTFASTYTNLRLAHSGRYSAVVGSMGIQPGSAGSSDRGGPVSSSQRSATPPGRVSEGGLRPMSSQALGYTCNSFSAPAVSPNDDIPVHQESARLARQGTAASTAGGAVSCTDLLDPLAMSRNATSVANRSIAAFPSFAASTASEERGAGRSPTWSTIGAADAAKGGAASPTAFPATKETLTQSLAYHRLRVLQDAVQGPLNDAAAAAYVTRQAADLREERHMNAIVEAYLAGNGFDEAHRLFVKTMPIADQRLCEGGVKARLYRRATSAPVTGRVKVTASPGAEGSRIEGSDVSKLVAEAARKVSLVSPWNCVDTLDGTAADATADPLDSSVHPWRTDNLLSRDVRLQPLEHHQNYFNQQQQQQQQDQKGLAGGSYLGNPASPAAPKASSNVAIGGSLELLVEVLILSETDAPFVVGMPIFNYTNLFLMLSSLFVLPTTLLTMLIRLFRTIRAHRDAVGEARAVYLQRRIIHFMTSYILYHEIDMNTAAIGVVSAFLLRVRSECTSAKVRGAMRGGDLHPDVAQRVAELEGVLYGLRSAKGEGASAGLRPCTRPLGTIMHGEASGGLRSATQGRGSAVQSQLSRFDSVASLEAMTLGGFTDPIRSSCAPTEYPMARGTLGGSMDGDTTVYGGTCERRGRLPPPARRDAARGVLAGYLELELEGLTMSSLGAREWAEQICLLSFSLFQRIHPRELLHNAWCSESLKLSVPFHLSQFIEFSARMQRWVAWLVVSPKSWASCRHALRRSLQLCRILYEWQNYELASAVLEGIRHSAVDYLREQYGLFTAVEHVSGGSPWPAFLTSEEEESLSSLQDLMDPFSSNTPSSLSATTSPQVTGDMEAPMIPLLAPLLGVLFRTEESKGKTVTLRESDGVPVVNWSKILALGKIMFLWMRCQGVAYPFALNVAAQEQLWRMPGHGASDEALMECAKRPKVA